MSLWASCLTPWASSSRPPSPNFTDSSSVRPWFRACATNPRTPRSTAKKPGPRACLPRSCPTPRSPATLPRLCPPASPGTLTISANRRIPFRVREKLVQAAQQPGAERRSESAMAWTGVPRGAENLLACSWVRGRYTHPAVLPAVWPGRGPRGEGGSESPRGAEAGGAGAGRARWPPPRKPPCPSRQGFYPPGAQPPGRPIYGGASL